MEETWRIPRAFQWKRICTTPNDHDISNDLTPQKGSLAKDFPQMVFQAKLQASSDGHILNFASFSLGKKW